MENTKSFKDSQIIILGICIAVATIVASVILSQGALKIMKFTKEVISVTGSAQKEIRSDCIVWNSGFSRREPTLETAYKNLKGDLTKVADYLNQKGVNPKEVIVSQIVTETVYKKNEKGNDTNDIEGYKLKQAIKIRSNDVDIITQISRGSTELIDQGVEFESGAPQYFYTDLDKLKIEMLANATENAKARAESIAKSTGNKVGFIRSAKMGVFQITPTTSTDVSDYGENDTSSLDKKVMAVVTASFSIE